MKKFPGIAVFILLFSGFMTAPAVAQSIEQQLVVAQNDQSNGGVFSVAVQVKGTGLPAANTLGSATIDVQYDNTKLTWVNATNWAFAFVDGYNRSANNNTTFIRVAVTGGGVNANNDGTPAGFDIGAAYTTWVQLNFTIASADGNTNLTIDNATNQVGVFENHTNNPNTGVINNQTLSAPVNIVGEPLPIQLASFTAAIVQAGQVKLTWSTLSETNNYGFEVQKAADSAKTFESIPNSFIAGNGTTTQPHEYTYTDVTAGDGTAFYRLKQTDLDGTVHFSESVQPSAVTGVAGRALPTEFALEQNYPNPFNPSTVIEFAVPKEARVRLDVYNLLGQKIATLVDENLTAGYYTRQFNGTGVASGLYFYRLSTNDVSFLKKMMLVK